MSLDEHFPGLREITEPVVRLQAIPIPVDRAPVTRVTPLPTVGAQPRCGIEAIRRYADHPSGALALNQETLHFTTARADGFIAYRPCGNHFFQLGGVFASPADQRTVLEDFRAMARRERKHICAVQLRQDDLLLYRKFGFRINQLGCCYSIDLGRFTMAGTRFGRLRNKISQARRLGITVQELGVDAKWSPDSARAMEAISQSWLTTKGAHAKLIDFMIGELGPPHPPLRRVFAAVRNSQMIAFVTFVVAHGRLPGMLHDLTRRLADAPPGVMDLITSTAIDRFRAEGLSYLHFGLSPLAGLSDEMDPVEGRSRIVGHLVRLLARYGEAIYPAQTQEQYKLKWGPHLCTPEYVGFEGHFRISALWHLLNLTRAI